MARNALAMVCVVGCCLMCSGAGAAPIQPDAVSGLQMWLKADSLGLADNADVNLAIPPAR